MLQTLRNAFATKELRNKLLYTLLILVIYRLGSAIPVPFLDVTALKTLISESNNFLGYLDILSGGAMSRATLFAMSITPYINASIIIQLLTVAIPALERLAKEGEEGRRVINKITRYTTLGLALIQAIGFYFLLRNSAQCVEYTSGFAGWFTAIVIIAMFTAGAALVVWLGERINEKGLGNGISLILFAGIISRAPEAFKMFYNYLKTGETKYYILVPLIVIIFLVIIAFIIVMTEAERRIPVQYAKRVVGRKMYGGQSSHIPVKLSMSGVMPIIFASSFVSIPGTIASFITVKSAFWQGFFKWFNYTSPLYAVVYFMLIIAFNYFYVSIQYNPIEISNNLRKNNGGIPGIRPGKPTSDFITKVLSKITLLGALFLAIIAIFPIIFQGLTKIQVALGGTTVLILVGVALETMRQLESQLMMRHHKGFLE